MRGDPVGTATALALSEADAVSLTERMNSECETTASDEEAVSPIDR